MFFYFWLENIFYRAYTEIKSYLFGKVFDKNLTSVWFVNAFSTPTLFPVLFHFFPFGGGHKSLFFTILLSPPFWLVRFELASYWEVFGLAGSGWLSTFPGLIILDFIFCFIFQSLVSCWVTGCFLFIYLILYNFFFKFFVLFCFVFFYFQCILHLDLSV